jgi:mono/diheme cytochrome c family protein
MRIAWVGVALLAASCRGWTSSKPPIHVNPNMDRQPKYRPQAESAFFADRATMRPLVPGTVARGELDEDTAFFLGKDEAGENLKTSPVEVTPELLARGAERYRIYCEPCHDPRGDGKGLLFQRGNVPTASFHTDALRSAADGYIFDVITNGFGLMQAYRWPIPPRDRWAIVAYIRVLERERQQEAGAKP